MLIGIDYSMTSPAVTIQTAEGYKFLAFPRKGGINKNCLDSLYSLDVDVRLVPDPVTVKKSWDLAQIESVSTKEAIKQTDIIIATLKEYTAGHSNIAIAIEGLSYGSIGNRLTQISGFHWVLRYRLMELGVSPDNIFIFAPTTVKRTAGKGNFKKEDVIDAFVKSPDIALVENKFWTSLVKDPSIVQTKTGKWQKPIDDIVDSYWVLKTLENYI